MATRKPVTPKPEFSPGSQASLKPAASPGLSSFRTASDLMKEEASHSENERRIERWAELMIRNKKVAPGWKEDRDATAIVRWISDRNAATPEAARPKKSKSKAGEE